MEMQRNMVANWAERFRTDLLAFLNEGDDDRNMLFLSENLPAHRKTIERWLREETPSIMPKKLANFYRLFLGVKSKDEFISKCPETILEQILNYGEQYLDEIKFSSVKIDKALFQEYFESSVDFRRVYYFLAASNEKYKVSEAYLTYKLGNPVKKVLQKMLKAGFIQELEGKLSLTDSFKDQAYDVRTLRSKLIKLHEEFATEEQFEISNNGQLFTFIMGLNEKGHGQLMDAVTSFYREVHRIDNDPELIGDIVVSGSGSMLTLDRPSLEPTGGVQ